MDQLPIVIRKPVPDDLNFILNSWLKSYRWEAWAGVPREQFAFCKKCDKHPKCATCEREVRQSYPSSPIHGDVYFKEQERLIYEINERSEILVACNVEEPDQVYGWVVASSGLLHYVYVKGPFRRFGIGGSLLDRAGVPKGSKATYTHRTRFVDRCLRSRLGEFNPYLAFRSK